MDGSYSASISFSSPISSSTSGLPPARFKASLNWVVDLAFSSSRSRMAAARSAGTATPVSSTTGRTCRGPQRTKEVPWHNHKTLESPTGSTATTRAGPLHLAFLKMPAPASRQYQHPWPTTTSSRFSTNFWVKARRSFASESARMKACAAFTRFCCTFAKAPWSSNAWRGPLCIE